MFRHRQVRSQAAAKVGLTRRGLHPFLPLHRDA
jgi:hypothetical protein